MTRVRSFRIPTGEMGGKSAQFGDARDKTGAEAGGQKPDPSGARHRGRTTRRDQRIRTTGTLQERTISVVVEPITRLRMRLWP